MQLLNRNQLQALLGEQNSPCVSIYLPTHKAGKEIQQDAIRLKNQLSVAEDLLDRTDLSKSSVQSLLQPISALLEDDASWRHQQEGLALFASPDGLRAYLMPSSPEETTVVSDRFYLLPVVPMLAEEAPYFILAASQNQVTLYEASRHDIQTIDLGDTPQSLEVALRYDDPEEALQNHSVASPQDQAIFHGQGGGDDRQKNDILRFFHLVSDGVEKAIAGREQPLVFVGVDFLFPIYQQTNQYPHLLDRAINVQPDQLSPEEIRDRTLEVVTPHLHEQRETAAAQYGSFLDKQQASNDLETILQAAHDGQIDQLFVARGLKQWGQYNPQARKVTYREQPDPSNQELWNLAVSQAVATGASVYLVEPDSVPGGGKAAAILRYPLSIAEPASA